MTAVAVLPEPSGGPFTRADLESMPDDGRRYELIDGCLLVTPAPFVTHQHVLLELAVLIRGVCPVDAAIFVAPLDVVLAEDTVVQPDILVARRCDLTRENLPAAPLLAVEILSRSTRSFDLGAKKERYERAGTVAYWVFDPDTVRLRAWELSEGTYVLAGDVSGDEAFEAEVPFPITVIPAALV